MKHSYFPLYVDISDKNILVAGAGKIALRRIQTLIKFETDITVTAPEICPEILDLSVNGKLKVIQREFETGDLAGRDIVLACTDSAGANREIVSECRKRGILVNTADNKELCDFYFPSVIVKDEVVIGINAGGKNHSVVKETREYLEKMQGIGL